MSYMTREQAQAVLELEYVGIEQKLEHLEYAWNIIERLSEEAFKREGINCTQESLVLHNLAEMGAEICTTRRAEAAK